MQKFDEEEEQSHNRHGGYTAAASWLASDPDNETLIFRKFDGLAALNLLYMQSEILELEKQVRDIHKITIDSYDLDLRDAASTWETLVEQSNRNSSEFRQDALKRMDLIMNLRKKLKEYHEALLLQSKISGLKQPENRVLKAVKHYFERPHHILGGKAKNLFDEKATNSFADVVALKPSQETDLLSNFLRKHWRDVKEESRDGITHFRRFKEESIIRTVNIVTILVAGIFLVGTIVGFYFVKSPGVKLGMIAGFTIAFAGCIGLITNARRAEIFAATAAYAAVLVVFVSNSDLSAATSTPTSTPAPT